MPKGGHYLPLAICFYDLLEVNGTAILCRAILNRMKENLSLKEDVEIISVDNGYLVSYRNKNWKISEFVYIVLQEFDGKKSKEEILREINLKYSSDDYVTMDKLDVIISFMISNNLLIGTCDVDIKAKGNKMLWGRITIFPAKLIEKFNFLRILYDKKIFIALLSLVCLWLVSVFVNNEATNITRKLYDMNILDIIICYIYIVLIGLFHEIGHSVALMKNEQPPGRIGAAVYFIMPVLFSDVTRAYRLNKKNRILVDIGGIYFQGILSMLLSIINVFIWKNEILDMALTMTALQIIGNFNPFIKLDGYWIISDYFNTEDIRKLFLEVIGKGKHKSKLSRAQLVILAIYGISFSLFMVYFIKMLITSLVMAITNIYNDLNMLVIQGIASVIENVAQNISNRILDVIVVIFFMRLCIGVIKKICLVLKKRRKHENY